MDKKQILIADDELDVLSVLKKGLAAEGYSVITTSIGEDVIGLAKSKCPDLIILDLEMPDMYGGDIARMLKDNPETKTIPVMFLTGMFPKEGDRKGGRVVAGHVLFEKPYDILELVTAIEELIGDKVLFE
jgi:CheY-like chemotaxis protein